MSTKVQIIFLGGVFIKNNTLRINKNTPKSHQSCKLEAPKWHLQANLYDMTYIFFPKKKGGIEAFFLPINMQNNDLGYSPEVQAPEGF